MADVCEIRPRKSRDGFNLTCGTLTIWYWTLREAMSYAEECLRGSEIIVYDEAGEMTQRIECKRASNSLSAW